jgi:hypothetical protein
MIVRSADMRALRRSLAASVLGACGFMVVMRLAVRGTLPSWGVALLAPLLLLSLVVLAHRSGVALGAVEPSRPLLRREGFWVVALGIVMALPTLGASGLVDPWETHYAEVAREMVERRDFVSPWWANEGWFMTKPVLLFWFEAIAMIAFGVRTGPDAVLGGASALARPEWAVRFPGFALAIVGTYILCLASTVFARLRAKGIALFGGCATVLALIVIDVYLPRCTSDGGQRAVIAAYYRDREASNQAPLVAYQLNWKGENFYTGNRLAIFVSSGAPMKAWLDQRRAQGDRTFYFVTERVECSVSVDAASEQERRLDQRPVTEIRSAVSLEERDERGTRRARSFALRIGARVPIGVRRDDEVRLEALRCARAQLARAARGLTRRRERQRAAGEGLLTIASCRRDRQQAWPAAGTI